MTSARSGRRTAGALLLLAGALLLAFGGVYLARSQAEGEALREQLRASAPATALPSPTAAVAATATARPAQPSATPTQEPSPLPSASATAARGATKSPTRVASGRAAAQPTPTVTATAQPTPTAAAPVASVAAAAGVEPVRIAFPDLKVDAEVVPMGWKVVQTRNGPSSEWVIPENEAGHHINSAKLGEPGNLVLSGHNNIYAQVFKPISLAWDNDTRQKVDEYTDKSDLLNGRRIQLYDAAGRVYDYVVTAFYRLKDTGVPIEQRIANGRYAQQTQDTRLTIITCWPPTNNTHRLILIAAPAPAQ